jgi:ComF family protein
VLEHPTRGAVCPRCWESILPITHPLCDQCGDPLPACTTPRCARCRRARRAVDRSRAIGEYDGALREIVHALKYGGRRSLAKPLAELMRQRGSDVVQGSAFSVPVPLHPSRKRERGFNQAEDLARRLGIPMCAALKRTRATAAQASLPQAQRHRNVREAFALTRAGSLAGATVLLIDDVSTTGATLDACARVLKGAGVKEVRALTAARVVSSPRR